MAKQRKPYTEEFRRDAVRMMRNRGTRTVAEVADDLGRAFDTPARARSEVFEYIEVFYNRRHPLLRPKTSPQPAHAAPAPDQNPRTLALSILDDHGYPLVEMRVHLKVLTLILVFASTTIASAFEAWRQHWQILAKGVPWTIRSSSFSRLPNDWV